jgi:hypothetical protein
MVRLKQEKNGAVGSRLIPSIATGVWLVFGWSQPAFPADTPHLKLAPIELKTNVGGDVSYSYLRNSIDSLTSTSQMFQVSVSAGITARTYFWKPWLARIAGHLQVGTNSLKSMNASSSANSSSDRTGNTTINGDTILHVLPHSRFPFKAHAFRGVNQTNGSFSNINSNYLGTGYDMTQEYRTRDGQFNSALSFVHGTNGRINIGTEDVDNQLELYMAAEPNNSHQSLIARGLISTKEHPLRGERSLSNSLTTNHSYRPNSEFSAESFLNLIKTDISITPTQQQNEFNSQQLSSISSWRAAGSPLNVVGSARVFKTNGNSSNQGVTTSTPTNTDTNFNLGANYAWSPLLNMNGSINVNDNNGIQSVNTAANLSGQKSFGEKSTSNVSGFHYTRSAGGSIGTSTTTTTSANQTTTTTSTQTLGGNIGHALSKSAKTDIGQLSTALNQFLSTFISSAGGPRSHLSTGGSVTLSHPDNKGVSMVRLTANDSRDLNMPEKYFQMINFQATRSQNLGRDQSLHGNMTLQGSRAGDKYKQSPFIVSPPTASATYMNVRLFRKKNLVFDSTLSLQGKGIASSNDPFYFSPTQPSVNWDNNLSYFIGRLKMNLHSHIAEIGNSKQSSILFTIDRSF